MNAQNIVSILSDLIANNLTVAQKSLITSQERQMAEYLADTVQLMTSGQKIDYVEETTLDFARYTDDEESEKEEESMLDEKVSEEMDEDWKNKEAALEKYNLRSFSEEFMHQVIDFVDYAGPGSVGKPFITDFEPSRPNVIFHVFENIWNIMEQSDKRFKIRTV